MTGEVIQISLYKFMIYDNKKVYLLQFHEDILCLFDK